MTSIWCVRANYGTYTDQFRAQGCAAIGWLPQDNLSDVATREDIAALYKKEYPNDSPIVVGQQVGQIARFLLDVAAGDVVITPDSNTELLWHGVVAPDPSYAYVPADAALPFAHRRKVTWASAPLKRSSLSVPLQNTLRSSLTVFGVSPPDEVLKAVGLGDHVRPKIATPYDPYGAVLERILLLDAKEFEILVAHLLTALGFEGAEVTGKVGDGGVDATGELNVSNLAKVKLFVQAKRYKPGQKVTANTVKQLRMAIPSGGQGAFITTSDYQQSASEVALEAGFPRIGLINGNQLVDLLIEHWNAIPPDFQTKLSLKPGLVLA